MGYLNYHKVHQVLALKLRILETVFPTELYK
jgi:hypothetical protein